MIAVVGVGRMGALHARKYARITGVKLAAVVDCDAERAETLADELGCDACPDVEMLFSRHPQVQAVSIAVPTGCHLAAAKPFLQRGIACLIEKPLAPNLDEARELAQLAEQNGAILQVGHTERFNPAVRAVVAMNITPRFMEVHRVSPMSFRSLDIGVVMDMMIHDLDLMLMFADAPIRKVDATGVAVLGEHEDVANARIEFESGCVANLTASRLALKMERKLRVFSEEAYVSLDYQKRHGVAIRKSHNAAALEQIRRELAAGADLTDVDYSTLVQVEDLAMELPTGHDDPLTAELASFIESVRAGTPPAVSAADGCAAIEAAEMVMREIREHRWEGLAHPHV